MRDNILTGVYEERIKKVDLVKLSKIFSYIIDDDNIEKNDS